MWDIMCSKVGENGDLITLDIGVGPSGRPVYRITWYRNGTMTYARYDDFKSARATWGMLNLMV